MVRFGGRHKYSTFYADTISMTFGIPSYFHLTLVSLFNAQKLDMPKVIKIVSVSKS